MRFPRRSVKTIVGLQLPSIITVPTNHGRTRKSGASGRSGRSGRDGLELVPIERSDSCTAKIVNSIQEEKEVVYSATSDVEMASKPLPELPNARTSWSWSRVSLRYRILGIIGIQLLLLLVIGLSLMSARKKQVQAAQKSQSPTSTSSLITSIPRGTFAVPLGAPRGEVSECLTMKNESTAWTCERQTLLFNILPSPQDYSDATIVAIKSDESRKSLYFGPEGLELNLVTINRTASHDSLGMGPGYFFKGTYDRTVWLQRLRDADGKGYFNESNIGQPMKPKEDAWLCTFNNTSIEGYIYPARNLTSPNSTQSTFGGPSATKVQNAPFGIKILEQRLSGSARPQCLQMTMSEDSKMAPVMSGNGAMTMLYLNEQHNTASCACSWFYL
ncbi:hypothetical protein B0J11DRAFT_146926 [Dendryphion nanum]|uniref:DUF7820 domain-containing protein n=1 Tax=Dendryphion nanum TaxID=256645 RepID=A0A9P9D5W9_9PLEO|nr:hypothetical protein B0J11DRAFT_146926 [Dendryphion nanum]